MVVMSVHFDYDSDQFISLLRTVLPSFPLNLDELRRELFILSPEDRHDCLDVLRDEPEQARRYILRQTWGHPNPNGIVSGLKTLFCDGWKWWTEKMGEAILKLLLTPLSCRMMMVPLVLHIYYTAMVKEIPDFFKGNPEPPRDYLTWCKTSIGITTGVIVSLISKFTSNNPKSLPTEIIESFVACCAVVGYFASLSTNKPKMLPFGCDPGVSVQKMGIVSLLATALGFTAAVLLLLSNNLFRAITMVVASAAIIISIFIKLCCPFSGEAANVPLARADANIPLSGEDVDLADMV